MAVITGVLRDEETRLTQLLRKYTAASKTLPKGSLSIKQRRGQDYVYLAYRKQGRLSFDYVGRVDSVKVQTLQKQIKSRTKYLALIKKIKGDLDTVKKALNGGKRKRI